MISKTPWFQTAVRLEQIGGTPWVGISRNMVVTGVQNMRGMKGDGRERRRWMLADIDDKRDGAKSSKTDEITA